MDQVSARNAQEAIHNQHLKHDMVVQQQQPRNRDASRVVPAVDPTRYAVRPGRGLR